MAKVYCTAPINGFNVREDGHVRTCCLGAVVLGDLNHEPIENIQQSPILTEIQQSIINNKKHKNCRHCTELEENSGVAPLRQHYLKFYPNSGLNHFELKNIDVRWNNSCNLGCLYCSPINSSTWADRLNTHTGSPIKNYQDDLLNFILRRVDEIDEISLLGGEPMLMKQNYELIAKLPDSARISIVTNLSYDLERLPCIPKLLSRPKENTVWNISCENINQQFEYVRSGAEWSKIETNLKFLAQHWPESVGINMVYSVFSAFDLVETIQKFYQIGIKKFTFQPYHGPPAIDVFSMPAAIQVLAEQILNNVVQTHYETIHPEDREFYPLVNLDLIKTKLMQAQENSFSKKEFYDQIAWYDQWSTNKFKDLWPHVIDLVELHLE